MDNEEVSVIAVDDNQQYTDLVEEFLNQELDVEVDQYQNPENVLSDIRNGVSISDYDVVISDWNMGGMNGGELGREIRKYSDIPIIYFTSEEKNGIDEVIADVGANYLHKEEFGRLSEEVKDLLIQRRENEKAVQGYAGNWDTTVTETESDEKEKYID